MSERPRTAGENRFWALAVPLLKRAGVTRSTMMGFPCLRLNGDFFASCDHRNGNLVIKLDERRVNELLDAGKAEPFAPSGRPFREWASVPLQKKRSWGPLLDEALELSSQRGTSSGRRTKRR